MAPLALRDRQLSLRPAILAVLFVVCTAGCLGGGPGASVETTTPTTTPTTFSSAGVTEHCPPAGTLTASSTKATDTPQTGTPTATVHGFTYEPDRETPVFLYNSQTEQVTMRVHISCEATSETVHDTNYTLQYGSRREAFDLTTVTPEGVGSSVTVAVSVGNTTESVTLTTTDCADVTARVTDDGTLRVDTSAC